MNWTRDGQTRQDLFRACDDFGHWEAVNGRCPNCRARQTPNYVPQRRNQGGVTLANFVPPSLTGRAA